MVDVAGEEAPPRKAAISDQAKKELKEAFERNKAAWSGALPQTNASNAKDVAAVVSKHGLDPCRFNDSGRTSSML
jgi:hypothetical protein